ncbi:MAG: glucoamylase family protein, partial [Daejeonella sp.]
YLGFSAPYDGTIAPSAVVASLPFIPESAIPSLKYMYQKYSDKIWGKYGFVDAFNPYQEWYDDGFLGIDKGNEVLMLENFRSGFIWGEYMKIPYVIEGMRKAKFDYFK